MLTHTDRNELPELADSRGDIAWFNLLFALPFLAEIELSKKQKREEREAEERQKTVVVGDMQPLAASLPTILSRYGACVLYL